MAVVTDGLREHYQPIGTLEDILVEKIIVETARYSRILSLEQNELGRKNAFFNAAIDRVGRYSTSTSRALFRAIDQLEGLQSKRKAVENAASSRKSAGVTAKTIDD